MQHLLKQVRPPIDAFEQVVINAFAPIKEVQAVWIREVRSLRPCTDDHPHRPTAACHGLVPREYTRSIWVQLMNRSPSAQKEVRRRADELAIRALASPFTLDVRFLVDELPPADIAPSCIHRKGTGDV